LRPGDFTLMDLCRPSEVGICGELHEVLAVQFPHAALPLGHDELSRLTAVPISGQSGLGASISSLARHLGRQLDGSGGTDGARLAGALMDLVIVALAQRLDRGAAVAPAARKRALLMSVQTFIEQHLTDSRLSPSMIAAAHHISLRSLHKLFEGQTTSTVCRWILERRLERCRGELLDPARSHVPVSATAFGWGFADAAHFSRAFEDAYGQPPAEYRRLHMAAPGA
jgi:AraC-like DNA-binding protein